jgi:putative SOS response-associated peptidase YedK
MCGRFVATSTRDLLADLFGAEDVARTELPPNWNVAPTDPVHVVADHDGTRTLGVVAWGRNWPINARVETVVERPAFRAAFRRRRCLIPADGFYEWEKNPAGRKQPYFIHGPERATLAFAGLWQRETCTIVTSVAAEPVSRFHSRSPVVLPPERWAAWLDADTGVDEALVIATASPTVPLATYTVSPRVNDVKNNDASLLEPADTQPALW